MLYTLSRADYSLEQLQSLLAHQTENDAVLLWQNGVLLAVKFPRFFANRTNIFVLENDTSARGIKVDLPGVTLEQTITLTEKYYPHFAL